MTPREAPHSRREFETASTLRDFLDHWQTPVGERGRPRSRGGRTSEQTERWIGRRLLLALSELGRLRFPLSFELEDRPDLRLYLPDLSIGVEFTEIVTQAEAAYIAEQGRSCRRESYAAEFRWGDRGLRTAERRQEESRGWIGSEPEEDMARAISACIETKLDALNRAGFAHYDENWLCAYDNHAPPATGLEEAAVLVPRPTSRETSFDRVFVLSDRQLLEIESQQWSHRIHQPRSWNVG